ncbi:hypothetical protein [Streptomyces anulatus]|uniref:hypothetical protein n=1 Tax=Streptomyces anulatus TaxID=1892 RepID=UPI003863F544
MPFEALLGTGAAHDLVDALQEDGDGHDRDQAQPPRKPEELPARNTGADQNGERQPVGEEFRLVISGRIPHARVSTHVDFLNRRTDVTSDGTLRAGQAPDCPESVGRFRTVS